MVKININNKVLFAVLLIVFMLIALCCVYAWENDMSAGTPSVIGHSAGEIMVNAGGVIQKLQEVLVESSRNFKKQLMMAI